MSSPLLPDSAFAAAPVVRLYALGEASGAPLPAQLTGLVERDIECAAISALLRDPAVHLLTLTGPGGVGKTRLAIAAASDALASFTDGVAFVSLAPIADAALVMPTIAWTLGLRDRNPAALHDHLVAALSEKRQLLLLDNFEQVVEAAPQLAALLVNCPGLTILVTSRVRLRLSAERDYPVAPLSIGLPTQAEDVGVTGAVRLFIERAQAIKPDLQLTNETLSAMTEIVRRVDGLPLAIELAAARSKALSPAALLQRLEQRLPLLSSGARDLPLRQQTMRDTIAWSYDLLSVPEQHLFRHVAVFAGGFTLEAAEAIEAPGRPHGIEVLDAVIGLVDHSVVQLVPGPAGTARYMMLETIREFALERLRADGEEAEFRQRHAEMFLEMAEMAEADLTGVLQAGWLDQLAVEYPNVQTALTWGLAHDRSLALRLATALRIFWRNRGRLGEGRDWLERALASGEGAPLLRARAMVAAASICNAQSEPEHALALAEAARAIFMELGDRRGIAEALRRIAPYYLFAALAQEPPDSSAFARVDALWEEELTLRQELGDRHGLAWAQHNLGVSALHQGDAARAAAWFGVALPLLESLEDRDAVAVTYIDLGRAAAQQAQIGRAAALYLQAFSLLRGLGDQRNIVHLLEDVAHLALDTDQGERTAHLLGAVDTLRAAKGLGLLTIHRRLHDQVRTEARRDLGETDFATAWETGRGLNLEQAIALALAALATVTEASDSPEHPIAAHDFKLTAREIEVLRLLADGLSDREIAEALFLSPRTVGWHVTHLLTKLQVQSRTAAVAVAFRLRLIQASG